MPLFRRPPPSVTVVDRRLGQLRFPRTDATIAPTIRAEGIWEPEEGLWLDHHVPRGGTVVNVGANVGYFTLWAAGLVGRRGRVLAIEPHPENARLLRWNIASHAKGIATPIEAAASAAPGQLELFINDENAGDHRVFSPEAARVAAPDLAASTGGFTGEARRIRVPAVTIDELVEQFGGPVDIVFTDTQGHDHEVLAGARNTLQEFRPLVMMEFVPAWIAAQDADPVAELRRLGDLGYLVGVWDAGIPPGAWEPEKIVAWAGDADRWFTNLELWPEERPLARRARPGRGFWPLERVGDSTRHWMVAAEAFVELSGSPGESVAVRMQLVPSPSGTATISVNTQPVSVAEPLDFIAEATLDESGHGRLHLTASHPAHRVPGEGRDLYVAVVDPTLM